MPFNLDVDNHLRASCRIISTSVTVAASFDNVSLIAMPSVTEAAVDVTVTVTVIYPL
jgi:hypothetical protein